MAGGRRQATFAVWGRLTADSFSGRLVARRDDGRDPRPTPVTTDRPADPGSDPLTARLCRALGVSRAAQIVTALYAPDSTRARIAALAPEVLAACDESPEDAARLLVPAGAALAEIVAAVARSLGWPCGPLPLAAAGSFLLSGEAVRRSMFEDLVGRGYQPALTAVPEPARGAVILAGRALAADGPYLRPSV